MVEPGKVKEKIKMPGGFLAKWSLAVAAFGLTLSLLACSSPGAGTVPAGGGPAVPAPSSTPTPSPAPEKSPVPAPAATPTAAGGEIKVTLEDNKFPEELRLKAGAKVVFVITNESTENTHSFEFPDLGVNKEINPRETTRFEWTVPDRKGTWDMGCFLTEPTTEPHDGMEGTLIIE